MALTNSQYNTIMKTYEEKQLAERHALDERLAFVNKTILALPFQFEYFFTYSSYLIVLTITSFIMLNKSDENWHPFLVPGCRGSLQFFIAACNVSCRLSYMVFIRLR